MEEKFINLKRSLSKLKRHEKQKIVIEKPTNTKQKSCLQYIVNKTLTVQSKEKIL